MIVVTNSILCKDNFFRRVEQITKGKPEAIMLREKNMDKEEFKRTALKCKEICQEYKVDFIINHQVETAKELQVKRIHLSLWELNSLGKRPEGFSRVGVSVHCEEEAVKAAGLGADYLVAGHIFATDCKKGLEPRGLEFLENICKKTDIPVYAIGGIKKEYLSHVYHRKAAGICIMSELMQVEEPQKKVREYMALWRSFKIQTIE